MALTAIEGMRFHAFHGVHQEEAVVGNTFSVDVYFEHDFEGKSDDLERCIDYEAVYKSVADRMKMRVQLIEHLAYRIADDLHRIWPATRIRVRVSKYNPLPHAVLERTFAEVFISHKL
ncbi:MAG: dihydroneopterin aldolase [Bacteroidota bacterium]